jgi:hypothetical protein
MRKKDLNNLRDCVKKSLENGSERGYEFKKMRFAIIAELKRLGFTSSEIKDKLMEWNQVCEKPLPPGEQKRQLLDYVDWTDKLSECKIGCKGLEDYCIGQDKCLFHKNKTYLNRKEVEILPLDLAEAKRFLETRYKADGYLLSLILAVLRRYQIEKATGEVMFIGYRAIASLIRDQYGHLIEPMTIVRGVQDLVSEGMLEIVSKGERGSFGGKPANGYRFLRWTNPTHSSGRAEESHKNAPTTQNNLYV